jgi:L-galactono-1,4-lactone dehydrogenase
MWIPYTDTVVVVQCNDTRLRKPITPGLLAKMLAKTFTVEQRREPFIELLHGKSPLSPHETDRMGPAQFREELLKWDPLDTEWIRRVNLAEEEHWKRSRGFRIGWSDEILGFDCGGQQWVLEVAFPTGGTIQEPGDKVRHSIWFASVRNTRRGRAKQESWELKRNTRM